MTPKEKAKELYDRFFYAIPSISDEGYIEHNTAKQCALIAVDEILSYNATNYWLKVKQEIEKL